MTFLKQPERGSKRSSRKDSHRDDRRRPPEKDERDRESERKRKDREIHDGDNRGTVPDKVCIPFYSTGLSQCPDNCLLFIPSACY